MPRDRLGLDGADMTDGGNPAVVCIIGLQALRPQDTEAAGFFFFDEWIQEVTP